MSTQKPREYRYSTDTTRFAFRCNPELTEQLKGLAAERRRSYSNTIRTLLYLGLEQYETNRLEGNTTGARRQAQAAQRRAEAEAKAARKQHKNVSNGVPLLVPLEFDDD